MQPMNSLYSRACAGCGVVVLIVGLNIVSIILFRLDYSLAASLKIPKNSGYFSGPKIVLEMSNLEKDMTIDGNLNLVRDIKLTSGFRYLPILKSF
jgi:hypothetical protein